MYAGVPMIRPMLVPDDMLCDFAGEPPDAASSCSATAAFSL